MKKKIDKPAIEKELIKLIQNILNDDSINIDPSKSLINDYGLDSLDLLDFSFNIEEIFGVKIGANELKVRMKAKKREFEIYDEDGNLSLRALEELRKNIPEIPPENFSYGLRPEDIPYLLNIKIFTRIVYEKLEKKKKTPDKRKKHGSMPSK